MDAWVRRDGINPSARRVEEAEKKFDGSDYGAHVIKVTRHVFFDLFDLFCR